MVPFIEKVLFIFSRSEIESVINAVNAAADDSLVIEVADFLFAVVLLYPDKLADSGESELSVVLANDANIVLYQHSL